MKWSNEDEWGDLSACIKPARQIQLLEAYSQTISYDEHIPQ
jgi:hypothetical protein